MEENWRRIMAARRRPTKRQPAKRPVKRREPKTEDDLLADELLRAEKRERGVVAASWDAYIKDLRKRYKPIGARKLQEMSLKEGIDPNKNVLSRGIIEM